ncbi:hypothetical protein U9M48_039791 [Paspalum notatum var. saurae]|uniref:RNase H type-1 domain-containing protein n=1 Tax=Paspalum notatum var. saurae TaxID=547442 RepID=A0AAQ3XEY1_PASNO
MSFLAWSAEVRAGASAASPTMLHLSRLAYSTNAQEIIQIMNNMRSDASPGPDGLNAAFYKASWSWIADDVINLIQDFYTSGHLPQDDLIICGQATQQEAVTINEVLQNFCALSGQTPNWNKSAILFSKKTPIVHSQDQDTLIWRPAKGARNDRTFNTKDWSVRQVLYHTMADLQVSQGISDEQVKCLVDASIPPEGQVPNGVNHLMAETLALKLAVNIVNSLGQFNCLYLSDSQVLVDSLNSSQALSTSRKFQGAGIL